MKEYLAIVTAEHAYLRAEAENENGENLSGIEDEIFSGWAVKVLEKLSGKQYLKIETHYGYSGYVKEEEIKPITEDELEKRQDKDRFFRLGISEADLLDAPKVQGLPLELLLKSCIVELLEKEVVPGWSKVRSGAGREGFIHTVNLRERKEDDGYLSEKNTEGKGYFHAMRQRLAVEEETFRERIKESALEYMGTQYRWGGKSSQGIDCSGLTFMSYLNSGLLIYRDASIREEFPVSPVKQEDLKTGDLIFFPGHVALYLGNGKYIHSTGYVKTPYVTINSLREEDEDYREDLAQKITGCGSVFI